jgi:uncharacterized protein (DUF2235 family)
MARLNQSLIDSNAENAGLRAKLEERDADAERYEFMRARYCGAFKDRNLALHFKDWPDAVISVGNLDRAIDESIRIARQSAQAAEHAKHCATYFVRGANCTCQAASQPSGEKRT